MTAETLNCPMCGAPTATDAPRCEHCGARLATVACPACFGMMFQGARFCSHCGALAARTELPAEARELCPRCRVEMNPVVIGKTELRECPRCEGLWVDGPALQQICADREQQSAVLGIAGTVPAAQSVEIEATIQYVPCPLCNQLMNRVNFAHCSHVIVDVCGLHGTWFDRDELRRIVEFIRAGGLEATRAKEMRELEEQRRRLREERMAAAASEPMPRSHYTADDWVDGLSAAASVLRALFG